jgi:hypothetical protein
MSSEGRLKLFGYGNEAPAADASRLVELSEVTLSATPDELRRIAMFLERCAEGMQAHGKSWEHEHLSDEDRLFADSPRFIVFNPECGQ